MERIGDESNEAILYVNVRRRILLDRLAHLTLPKYLINQTAKIELMNHTVLKI